MSENNLTSQLSSLVYGRVAPHSKELEEAILGVMLLIPSSILNIKQILKPSDFYFEQNQIICSGIYEVSDNHVVDINLMIEFFRSIEKLEYIGGPYKLVTLTNNNILPSNIDHYCRIIKEKSIKRNLIQFAGEILNTAYEDSQDVFDVLDQAEIKLKGINFELNDMKVTQIHQVASNVLEKFDSKIYCAKNNIINENEIFTRMPEWDKINGPLFNGLYVVAGRPGMGKGVHLTEIACRMGKEWPIGIINGEMTNEQLMVRIACNLKNLDNQLWKKDPSLITEEEQSLVHEAINEAINLKISIYDQRDIHRIANKIKLWIEKDGVRCVLIDFLTLLKVSEDRSKFFSEQQRINYMLEILASIAKELKIPIILYVQMNRDIEKRAGDKEPNLADIKGSGTIEEFAYQISFLHRPEYYNTSDNIDAMGESTKDLCYQIIAKHRDGMNGKLKYRAILKSSQLKPWEDSFDREIISGNSTSFGSNWVPINNLPKF